MIVLSGGIGSGKSVVARVLRLQGFGVFDCDREAKILMETDATIARGIKDIAGEDVYDGDRLNRPLLATRLFSDTDVRKGVNTIVHSAVKNKIREWLDDSPSNKFVETAIPAESGLDRMADEVWFVEASAQTRLERVRMRDSREDSEIERIMRAQAAEEKAMEEKGVLIKRIFNNPEDSLLSQISDLLTQS